MTDFLPAKVAAEMVRDDYGREFTLVSMSGIVNRGVGPSDFNSTDNLKLGDCVNVIFRDVTRPPDPRIMDTSFVGCATYTRTR